MAEVGVHKAKTELSKLLKRVAMGEEIIITRNGEPVAKLVPIEVRKERVFGLDAGLVEISEDFDDPLPDEILELFES
ncbi:MAG: type II toxin-antitoxin system Phd/YefM family antitoxin [Actinomycetota bacterium]|nr:type II toxin-antitoxin system Phd/YefM family antitoxin [Actinomycetota bacterium]